MIENSAAGLVMVPGEVTVTVTGEEHHQETLARYAVPAGVTRHVAVHLTWCAITAGKHRGQRGIEVRLDGQRVGELTFLMSQRYAPVLMQVESGGGATGCGAVVQRGGNGLLQIVLRLPREVPRGAVVPVASSRSWVAPVAIAAGSLFAFFIAVVVAAGTMSGPSNANKATGLTTTAPTTTTTVAPPITTTTTTTTTSTTTTTTTTTPPAVTQPKPPAQPAPQPAPKPSCHASYSPCVPIASDVDCSGGTGNGPVYVTGPIRVIGPDVYDLDRDGNGTGCE